ncbi:hypothetical protein [Bacillus sp. JCM 19041]|uniref:hypothetical protein n=1 Tax=Bacillus sp. JCM 19041 TaxID=1460637 RepID=UPI0006D0ECB2
MGLSLINLNSNKSLERKIRKCIALLDDEYKDLNFTINFYGKREKLQKERNIKPDLKEENYLQILAGKYMTTGLTIGEKGEIKIFLFHFGNLKKKPREVILLIGNIFHEIRHAWQFKNGLFQDENEITVIDENPKAYYRKPSEKDAYIFQEQQMKKHGGEILEIFGFLVEGYEFELNDEIKEAIYS